MLKNCAVTIVSGNYLAYARVLGASLATTEPNFDFRVLIVDRKTPALLDAVRESGLDASFAEDLNLPDAERLFYKYDIVELNTALKPTFLKQTFALGYQHVLYLDPDIRVYAPLTPVLDALSEASIVLTPHALNPVMDGLRPSDVDFLRTGVYNLGFIGLKASDQTKSMLDWWESRCLGLGFNDTAFGIFVDQKWINLVPCYFSSVYILRHPGCNVAYWNLHERQIEDRDDKHYLVNGSDLIYFHFSGVVPSNPLILSKHQTRHSLQAASALSSLVTDYCQSLNDLGHHQYAAFKYGFGSLDDGTHITPTMRRALLVVPYEEQQPFKSNSRLQQELVSVGITVPKSSAPSRSINTMTFDAETLEVRMANRMLRVVKRILGVERLLALLRYAALMTRESHLPAVLLKQPLRLSHKTRR
jgi:hypothetical protein